MLQSLKMRRLPVMVLFTSLILSSSATNSRYTVTVTKPAETATTKILNTRELEKILTGGKPARFIMGKSKKGRDLDAYFFPGWGNKNALVIGGMHGSELSSIEVANALLGQLTKGDSIFYNVIIIPSLFPDNAETAKQHAALIGSPDNKGRYSYPGAVDPNRQMPTPGKPYDELKYLDHAGRKIETENALLLELIEQFRPQRIVNLHAIRNTACAGVFADPRADQNGIALGYESDSSLAVSIAKKIHEQGGHVPGNGLTKKPTALYYKDPTAAPAGMPQKRNYSGSPMPGHRGGGISLGTWASTTVFDEKDPSRNRNAIRILTVEFPGSKRPVDHKKELQAFYTNQVQVYAAALKTIFLGNYFVEE